MKRIEKKDIVQGSDEWLELRNNYIGASEVAALFDSSPYLTQRDLFLEKMGISKEDNSDKQFIFNKGHHVEKEILAFLEDEKGLLYAPTCFILEDCVIASLDGYDVDLGVLEVKYVGQKAGIKMRETGEIPEHHMFQVQTQMLASGAKKALYAAAYEVNKVLSDVILIEVLPDEHMQNEILRKAREFKHDLDNENMPGLSAKDTQFKVSSDLDDLLANIYTKNSELKALTTAIDELKAKIEPLLVHEKVESSGVKITKSMRQGIEIIRYTFKKEK